MVLCKLYIPNLSTCNFLHTCFIIIPSIDFSILFNTEYSTLLTIGFATSLLTKKHWFPANLPFYKFYFDLIDDLMK